MDSSVNLKKEKPYTSFKILDVMPANVNCDSEKARRPGRSERDFPGLTNILRQNKNAHAAISPRHGILF